MYHSHSEFKIYIKQIQQTANQLQPQSPDCPDLWSFPAIHPAVQEKPFIIEYSPAPWE